MEQAPKKDFVIVTGLSGSGLSSVLKTLEDLGFEVFDNFPLDLIDPLLEKASEKPIALGIDTRTRGFEADELIKTVDSKNAHLLFITCDETILQKRFTETRRRHPLAKDRPVREGITQEQSMLKTLQDRAGLVVDTTELNIHDLRHILEGHFQFDNDQGLTISLMSFGFRRGTPREADIVMDVRFLQNPNWVADLKHQSGLDKDIGNYVAQDPEYENFMQNFKNLMEPLLPRYTNEGKRYLTLAIGCTGGRHRSVFIVETLSEWLKDKGFQTHIEHRDLEV